MSGSPLLQVDGLGVTFAGGMRAVDSLSLHVDRGETLGIVGESGSGKSVSCHALVGLLPSDAVVSGLAQFDGERLLGASARSLQHLRRHRIGMIFQDPVMSLNPSLRIGDQITEPMRLFAGWSRRDARARAVELLEEVGIADPASRVDDYPYAFSGGMCQRVMIAMALVMEPDLLIADEPTSALDVQTQAAILELLGEIQNRRKLGILFISHDLDVVRRVSGRVLVMQRGRMVEAGDTAQVFANPTRSFTRALIAAIPAGESRLANNDQATLNSAVLSVANLNVSFPGADNQSISAVQNVSFELGAGEVLGLVGESGSGKTTLARSLVGLKMPDNGEVRTGTDSLASLALPGASTLRKRIQMVFQDPYGSLNPRMTIQQIVSEPLRLYGLAVNAEQSGQRVAALLEEVGLANDIGGRFPHQFSGGQRQRIALARALACEPDVLIADEMVSALDVTVQAKVLELLLTLVERRGLAVLFISHDLAVVRSVSTRVMVMKDGEIVEQGPTRSVMQHPEHWYTQQLVKLALPEPDSVNAT